MFRSNHVSFFECLHFAEDIKNSGKLFSRNKMDMDRGRKLRKLIVLKYYQHLQKHYQYQFPLTKKEVVVL